MTGVDLLHRQERVLTEDASCNLKKKLRDPTQRTAAISRSPIGISWDSDLFSQFEYLYKAMIY